LNEHYLPTTEFDPKNLHQFMNICETKLITNSAQSLDSQSLDPQITFKNNSNSMILTPGEESQWSHSSINVSSDLMFQRRHCYHLNSNERNEQHSIRDIAL
jgi:hypothetical protein